MGPAATAPTASPVTAPRSDCFDPAPGGSAASPAYAGKSAPPPSASTSAVVRSVDVFMFAPRVVSGRKLFGTSNSSAHAAACAVGQMRQGEDDLWHKMARALAYTGRPLTARSGIDHAAPLSLTPGA